MAIAHFVRECRHFPAAEPVAGVELRVGAAASDVGLVTHLAQAVAEAHGRGPTPAGLVAELASRPGRTVESWLALEADTMPHKPLGIVILATGLGEAGVRHSISWLIVHPLARRRGVGRWLVAEACGRAADRGATEVSVECHTAWHDAMAFWRSVGFEESSRRLPPTRLGEQFPG